MAISTCIKCGGTKFEQVIVEDVKDAVFKLRFIQCAACGGVVGVQEFDDNNTLIETLAHKLGKDLH